MIVYENCFLTRRAAMTDVADDGVLVSDFRRARELWAMREGCAPAHSAVGYVFMYDVSLPADRYYAIVEAVENRLRPHLPVGPPGFGENISVVRNADFHCFQYVLKI